MKKSILLLNLVIVVSCNCLPQIPIQTIYADENCEAVLPDYLQLITVLDNCEGATVTQSPPGGYLLDNDQPYIEVTIEAVDPSGNYDRRRFDVVMLDTIPPKIVLDESLLTYSCEQKSNLITAYQHSIYNDISNSAIAPDDPTYFEQHLVTISSLSGRHFSTFVPTWLTLLPLNDDQISQLGYTKYTIPIEVLPCHE